MQFFGAFLALVLSWGTFLLAPLAVQRRSLNDRFRRHLKYLLPAIGAMVPMVFNHDGRPLSSIRTPAIFYGPASRIYATIHLW